jgi:hypothetical protein
MAARGVPAHVTALAVRHSGRRCHVDAVAMACRYRSEPRSPGGSRSTTGGVAATRAVRAVLGAHRQLGSPSSVIVDPTAARSSNRCRSSPSPTGSTPRRHGFSSPGSKQDATVPARREPPKYRSRWTSPATSNTSAPPMRRACPTLMTAPLRRPGAGRTGQMRSSVVGGFRWRHSDQRDDRTLDRRLPVAAPAGRRWSTVFPTARGSRRCGVTNRHPWTFNPDAACAAIGSATVRRRASRASSGRPIGDNML